MGKTVKGKRKTEAKIAKAERKIARKCKGVAAVGAALALAALVEGCATSDAAQPAKANTMENKFEDCIIVVAAKARIPTAGTNIVIEANGDYLPTIELFTQTQSLENSGTETTSQTATQTPTTDVKPDVDVTVPVTKGVGGEAADAAASLAAKAASSACEGDACKE